MVNLAFYHLAAKQSLKGQGFDGVWMLVHHRLRREFAVIAVIHTARAPAVQLT
jgi:hypothetical protein